MSKPLIIGGAVAGAALLGRRCARACRQLDWETLVERMPDNAPPKWMFRNVTAIRENTERILERLEAERVADQTTGHSLGKMEG